MQVRDASSEPGGRIGCASFDDMPSSPSPNGWWQHSSRRPWKNSRRNRGGGRLYVRDQAVVGETDGLEKRYLGGAGLSATPETSDQWKVQVRDASSEPGVRIGCASFDDVPSSPSPNRGKTHEATEVVVACTCVIKLTPLRLTGWRSYTCVELGCRRPLRLAIGGRVRDALRERRGSDELQAQSHRGL